MNAPASPIFGPQDRFANLEAIKGETYNGQFGLFNADGVTPIDLEGYTLTMFIWEGSELKHTVVCEASEEQGWNKVDISSAVMSSLNPVAHHFELWADNGLGQVKLVVWGWFWVKGECLS